MSALRSGRLIMAAVTFLAIVLGVGAGGVGASTPGLVPAIDDEIEPPEYEHDEPEPFIDVDLAADVSDWSWPGVYDSAFRIDYTVTNNGNVRLNGFFVGETNAERIVDNCGTRTLAPGQTYSCTALLYQTVNPQTVKSIVTGTTDSAPFFIGDFATSTYTRRPIYDGPPILDLSEAGIGQAG